MHTRTCTVRYAYNEGQLHGRNPPCLARHCSRNSACSAYRCSPLCLPCSLGSSFSSLFLSQTAKDPRILDHRNCRIVALYSSYSSPIHCCRCYIAEVRRCFLLCILCVPSHFRQGQTFPTAELPPHILYPTLAGVGVVYSQHCAVPTVVLLCVRKRSHDIVTVRYLSWRICFLLRRDEGL